MDVWNEGEFCWVELAVTNLEKAKEFYQSVFGWEFSEMPSPDGGTYTMWKVQGVESGGIYELAETQRQQNIPPHFGNYLFAKDATQFAAKTKELGGTVLKDAFDVGDMGRMAVMADPAGAVFYCWQASKNQRNAAPQFAQGKVAWRELMTHDVEKVGKFYCDLVGWNIRSQDMGGFTYHEFLRGDSSEGGMVAIDKNWGDTHSQWLTYVNTDDCDKAVATAKNAGAKVLSEIQDVPEVGRFAVLEDPQGAVFAPIRLERN